MAVSPYLLRCPVCEYPSWVNDSKTGCRYCAYCFPEPEPYSYDFGSEVRKNLSQSLYGVVRAAMTLPDQTYKWWLCNEEGSVSVRVVVEGDPFTTFPEWIPKWQ